MLRGGGAPSNTLPSGKTLIGCCDLNGNSYAFINFAKLLNNEGGDNGWQSQTNSDGYPSGALTSNYGASLGIPAADQPALLGTSVKWRIKWKGKGGGFYTNGTAGSVITVTSDPLGCVFATGGGLSRFSCTMNGTTDYVEFTNAAGATQIAWSFNLNAVVYDGTMQDFRIYRSSDQARMDAGEIFTTEALNLFQNLNPRYVRTMDWGDTNGSIAANFSQRTTTTAFTYRSQQFNPARSAGSTSGTNTYTASNPSGYPAGAYQDGETFQVVFSNASTGASTINFGARGAATIAFNYGFPVGSGDIPANSIATCVYSSKLVSGRFLCNFSNPSNNNNGGGLDTGVPIEIQVALANKLNIGLWYNFPFLYLDASITSATQYVRDNLNSSSLFGVEFSNEVWNFLFQQTSLATYFGQQLGIPADSGRQPYGYYGFRVQQVQTLVTAAWSPRSTTTLRRVLANWKDDPNIQFSTQGSRMNGQDLQAYSTTITNVSASATTPTVTSANTYSQGQGLVISGITGTGAISTLNGQTVYAMVPTVSNYVVTARNWSGSGYIAGTTFTVTSTDFGTPAIGQYLDNGGPISSGTIITGGSFPTFTVNNSQTIGSSGSPSSIQGYAPISTAGGTYTSGGSVQTLYAALGNTNHATGSPTFNRPIDAVDSISYAQYEAGALINNGGAYGLLNAADVAALKAGVDANDMAFFLDDLEDGIYQRQTFTASGTTFTTTTAPGTNSAIQFKVSAGGTLPTGITTGTIYLTINLTGSTFQVRTMASSTPISVSGGSGTFTWGLSGQETLRWSQYLDIAVPNNKGLGYEQIAASYDGARPGGFSNLKVEQYEGAYEMLAPQDPAQCTTWGISTTYCGATGLIAQYIENWKNNASAAQYVNDHFNAFMNISPGAGSNHSVTPGWFALQGPSVWSLLPGSTLSTPYQSYKGNCTFNGSSLC